MACITACTGNSGKTGDEEGISTVLPEERTEVTVQVLERKPFLHELISNGKVETARRADLRFETAEVIARVYVENGDRVRQGQKLAELDVFQLDNALAQAEEAWQRAQLDMKDVVIGQGYNADELSRVPEEVLRLAEVRSGYTQARSQYELAKYRRERAVLTAPFDGLVANLFTKSYNIANTAEPFCTILSTDDMEVSFTVLESELSMIRRGDPVKIVPYMDGTLSYEGTIAEINPMVDENGQVKVKARVKADSRMLSGMNVRVKVQRLVDNALVIPKTAVVMRSGKQVVFILKDGLAMWNYVQTSLDNSESCIVSERTTSDSTNGLAVGDTVIITGNVNLSHESPVTVVD
jgi:RND family efflux transporter MFP subunit